MNRLEKALAAIPDTYLDHCPPLLDSFDAGIVAAQLVDLLESGGARQAVAEWFIGVYHADYLTDCLHSGDRPEPWEPHVGQRAQAAADAEQVLAALVAYLTEQTEENTDGD